MTCYFYVLGCTVGIQQHTLTLLPCRVGSSVKEPSEQFGCAQSVAGLGAHCPQRCPLFRCVLVTCLIFFTDTEEVKFVTYPCSFRFFLYISVK